MEYKILIAEHPKELQILVNDYIKKGYIPQGGVSGSFRDYFYQAVVKP